MMLLCLHLVLRGFDIANPFYFDLSEVVFHLDQERKLPAINWIVFFAKKFLSSLNSSRGLSQLELKIDVYVNDYSVIKDFFMD